MEFELKGKKYSYVPIWNLDPKDLPSKKTYSRSKYLDIGCAFDIETSRINDEKLSTMYVWQFGINDMTIIGRTWDEFRHLLTILKDRYSLDKKHRLLVLVHNLSFEFSFIKGQLKWGKEYKRPAIFATDNRTVVKATTEDYIEFRDTVILSQQSLEKLAKNHGLNNQKLVGDLDYSLPRHYLTPLTNEELAYCINDVQILTEYYHKYIKKEFVAKQQKIPLTSTGIVRADLRRSYRAFNRKEKVIFERELKRAFPDYDTYKLWIQWLFRGGMVHANASLADQYINTFEWGLNLGARDIKSSYPAVLLQENYPYRFVERDAEWFYKYGFNKQVLKKYAYYGQFTFYNIRAKTQHSIESKNKLIIADNCLYDNGRLIKGDRIRVILNDVDMLNYLDFYEWAKIECDGFFVADKKPLPRFVKDIILKYFYNKETSKDKYIRNVINKPRLNSCYGMMVSGLLNQNLVYNEELKVLELSDNQKEYEEIIKNQILLPQWGIWCTSYARQRLLYAFKNNTGGDSCIYGDTDSCKYIDSVGNEWIFNTFNDRIRRINKNMYTGKYDPKFFEHLGCFEDETEDTGRIVSFKTLGAKRYIYTCIKDGKLKTNVTVAGLKKGSLQKYCEDYDLNIYDVFKDGMTLNSKESHKMTTAYEDAAFEREFTDYNGLTVTVKEESCVTLYDIPFEMNMLKDYLALIEGLKALNERRLIKRRY